MTYEIELGASRTVTPGSSNLHRELSATRQLAAVLVSLSIPKYLKFDGIKSFTICLPPFHLRFVGEFFLIGGLCTLLRGRDFRRNDLISGDDNIAFSQIRS